MLLLNLSVHYRILFMGFHQVLICFFLDFKIIPYKRQQMFQVEKSMLIFISEVKRQYEIVVIWSLSTMDME